MTLPARSIRRLARALCALCAVAVLAAAPGCGYSLAGRGSFLPSYVKTIGIPNFTNRTTIFNLETQLTQKVRTEFIGRGKYQIVPDDTGVDAVLTGEILSAVVVPVSIGSQTGGQVLATGNAVTVTARLELRSLHDNSVIWQNAGMSVREEYSTRAAQNVSDPNAFFTQDATALDRLTTDFARTIVSAILEAF